jgi:hypothetical protein
VEPLEDVVSLVLAHAGTVRHRNTDMLFSSHCYMVIAPEPSRDGRVARASLVLIQSKYCNVPFLPHLPPTPGSRLILTWHDFVRSHRDVYTATGFFHSEVWSGWGC